LGCKTTSFKFKQFARGADRLTVHPALRTVKPLIHLPPRRRPTNLHDVLKERHVPLVKGRTRRVVDNDRRFDASSMTKKLAGVASLGIDGHQGV
jgi:hypothetical protein